MLEELGRNHSQATTRYYIRAVEDFSRRLNRPPDCSGPQHIREYQAELLHSGYECRWTATFADGMVDSISLPVFCYPVLKLEVRVPAALNPISECLQHQLFRVRPLSQFLCHGSRPHGYNMAISQA
jgi:hypothetical protein